ncbi:MAG: nicotinate-nucleotide adenylyltransferase [Calditrichia bacterium]
MKKIGIFGGTFDPVHNGHLIIAEFLRDELKLQEIWFIPAKVHPLKENKTISSAADRLQMLEMAVENNSCMKVSTIELERQGTSYTIDTLNALKHQNPDCQFYFFMGMDNINELHQWKNGLELVQQCRMIAFGRPGFQPRDSAKPYLPHIQFVHVPLLEISSTFIRQRWKADHSIRYLVPAVVEAYIRDQKLYK